MAVIPRLTRESAFAGGVFAYKKRATVLCAMALFRPLKGFIPYNDLDTTLKCLILADYREGNGTVVIANCYIILLIHVLPKQNEYPPDGLIIPSGGRYVNYLEANPREKYPARRLSF